MTDGRGRCQGRRGLRQLRLLVNDAGAFINGRMEDVSLADQRRLFDVT